MEKIKYFFKNNWLAFSLLLSILALAIIFNFSYFNRLFIDIKVIFDDILYYIIHLFNKDYEAPKQVYEILKETSSGESFDILPEEWNTFVLLVQNTFKVMVASTFMKYGWDRLTSSFGSMTSIVSMFAIVIPMFSVLVNNFFSDKEFEVNNRSLGLKVWWLIYDHVIAYIIKAIKWFINKINHKWFIRGCIFAFMFYTGTISLILNFFSYYFYFISAFDFNVIWQLVLCWFVTLFPIIFNTHPIVWILIAYFIFNKIRLKLGYAVLEGNELQNIGFIKGCGIITLINGGPETGKTKTMTDMGMSAESLFRSQCEDIMNEIRDVFPYFRWDLLEKKIDVLCYCSILKNPVDVESYFRNKLVYSNPNRCDYYGCKMLFDFDYRKYGYQFDNGNVYENLFDDIVDYAKAYFVYRSEFALMSSNYPIRIDPIKYDNGLGQKISWIYDIFGKTPQYDESMYSKIIDFDTMRLGKKFSSTNEHLGITMGFSICLTEIGKERGNTLENQEVKKAASETNVKNDGFTDYLRVGRHPLTIRHRSFVKVFLDEQRASSVGVALSGISETILTIDKNNIENGFALPFFELDDLILGFIMNKLDKFSDKYYHCRNDRNLLLNMMNYISKVVSRRYNFIHNTFDYKKVTFYSQNGTLPEKAKESLDKSVYYLANKKIHANRYASDYLRTFFDEKSSKSKVGFGDLEEFNQVYPQWDDFDKMNSYFSDKLKTEMELTKKKESSSAARKKEDPETWESGF